ncbi:unnamed protein product [Calypogeia fissa]
MEDERMDGNGHRWASYAARDRDLLTHNRVQEYDPYEIDSRQAMRSGHYVDEGEQLRGPANMKTLLANQQLAGRRKPKPSAVAHHVIRKEGTNWILIVGGALVAALGVMIVRRQKTSVPPPKAVEKALLTRLKDHVHHSGISFRRESTGSRTSELSAESPYSGDPFMITQTQPQSLSEGSRVGSDWGDEECSPQSPPATYYEQFAKGSCHSNRVVITPTSPPGSYRGADTSATECNDLTVLSPPARLGYPSRRDMVHRLRQQLKSRDEMILDMQAQISDQERLISLHQARCKDLESRLEEANNTLFESNLEIQRLRRAVAEYLTGQFPSSGNSSSISSRRDAYEMHQQDDSFLLRESQRLAKELEMREEEKQELERLADLRIKEHELVVQKLQMLESELEEARKSDFEKDLLLDAYEVEHESLEDRVDNLKRLVESKAPEKESTPSMIGRNSLSGGVGINREEGGNLKAEDFRARARNLMRSYSLICEKSGEQPSKDVNSLKGRLKLDEGSSTGDISDESEAEDSSPAFSEKLVTKLKQEVEQLSTILAEHCETISEKRLETSRLVDEFQRQNAFINDIQKRLDEDGEVTPEPRELDRKIDSQHMSFSTNAASVAQVQELNHKLEEIAQRQRVEEEIADLSKHQVKIAELKQRVEKLLNRCNSIQEKGKVDAATRGLALRMAATGFELAKQLHYQEEQARRTSREVQRLSASFELSSPYVPRSKKEELRKMLQDCSSESSSPPTESGPPQPPDMSHVISPLQTRFTSGSEENPKEIGDNLFDRAISVSSAEPATTTGLTTTPRVEGGVALQLEEQCVFRPGFSGPSTRKLRRGFPINSGSGKEQSPGSRKRMARGVKNNEKGERKELVRSDSNRWVHKASKLISESSPDSPHEKHPTARHNAVDWANDNLLSQSTRLSGNPWDRTTNTVDSQMESSGDLGDPSTMSIGSPTSAGHNVSLETSVASTKSSFGRFVFDMETGDRVHSMNQDEGGEEEIASPTLAPCTEMMSKLDLKEVSAPSLSPDGGARGGDNSGLSKDLLNAIKDSPLQDNTDKDRESIASEASVSTDSSLDALLSNTLEDLVLLCSAPATPADTPRSSSLMSSNSDSVFPM